LDPHGSLSALRRSECGRLDSDDQVYLDYTGGGLHAASELDAFTGLRHANGPPVVQIHGPTDTTERGGTVTFLMRDPIGHRDHGPS